MPALVDAIVAALAALGSVWIGRRFGEGRTSLPGLDWLNLEYVRAAAVFVAAIALPAGIGLSTSDHSHKTVSYVLWYGLGVLAVLAAVVLTIIIDRRGSAGLQPEPERQSAGSQQMNRMLRDMFQQHKGAVQERERSGGVAARQHLAEIDKRWTAEWEERESATRREAHITAEKQLAAAIRSGRYLRTSPPRASTMVDLWRRETVDLVRQVAGDLEAARLDGEPIQSCVDRLDALAGRIAAEPAKLLTPSERWDRFTYLMSEVHDQVVHYIDLGEWIEKRIAATGREEVSLAGSWQREVAEVLVLVPELQEMARDPAGVDYWIDFKVGDSEVNAALNAMMKTLQGLRALMNILPGLANALGSPVGADWPAP